MNIEILKRSRWDGGKLFAFSAIDGSTDYAHGLVARSIPTGGAPADGEDAPAPAIEIKFPGECSIRFPAAAPASAAANTVGSDWFEIGRRREIRGVFLDAHHLLIDGPCEISAASPKIKFEQKGARTLVGAARFFYPPNIGADFEAAWDARRKWLENLTLPGGLAPAAARAFAKSASQMKSQVCSPEGAITRRWTTPDRYPHKEMWLWDSAFHAIGWRHLDPAVAADAIDAALEYPAPGFIPHMMSPRAHSDVTQPPVLAFATMLVYEKTGDKDWLARAYPRLKAYLEWDFANRDRDGDGLLEWMIDPDPNCRSGESGLDNSPRFDDAQLLAATDFNSFAALECETLSNIAEILGHDDDAKDWYDQYQKLCALISAKLWDPERGFFFDYDSAAQRLSPVQAVSGFFPLICGAATAEQAEELVEALHNPALFGTPYRVPSIASSDPKYKKDMWKGPVWINANWLIAHGLDRAGFPAEAAALRAETRILIETEYENYGAAFEFYDADALLDPPALQRKGVCDPASPYHQVIHDYGWTATLYVDLVCN